MTRDERRAFLLEGTRTGHVATVDADGRPHVAPVWFTLDGDDLVWMTGSRTVKGRNLRRGGWAAVTVDDPAPPYGFVLVRGPVELSGDVDEMYPWALAISERYMGPDRAVEYARRNAVEGELLVRLRPDHVVAHADLAG